MPILLDEIEAQMSNVGTKGKKIYTPKFFDSKLTGSGKKSGIINEQMDPGSLPAGITTNTDLMAMRKKSYASGQTNVSIVPIALIPKDQRSYVQNELIPDLTTMTKFGTGVRFDRGRTHKALRDNDVYASVTVYSVMLEETPDPNGGNKRKLSVAYCLDVYGIADPAKDKAEYCYDIDTLINSISSAASSTAKIQNYVCHVYTSDLKGIGSKIAMQVKNSATDPNTVDETLVADLIQNYSLYDGICEQARIWAQDAAKMLENFFQEIVASSPANAGNETARVLRRLEDYAVPLEAYLRIYDSLKNTFKPDEVTALAKQNMNLLFADILNSIERNKSQIQGVPVPAQKPAITIGNGVAPSVEQERAITSEDPLILVQAGAGTGKSSVILSRIKYMTDCGINPEDITVLSFTNAAANHIANLCGSVHSMTIAKMIDIIYRANYTNHTLSTIDTIVNCVDIYYKNDPVADKFKYKLKDIIENKPSAFIMLNNFVENHFDEVIAILDNIGQTSLELEIIICYQKIDTFVEPKEVQSKYLIIDEVQDNSVFEFVYAIKYVEKHKESLYIVGDCSQTLYEFRASNPKALNILEASGVFKTYPLQINYRSNQEILDFANIALQNIEANQYAHIQLQANSLAQVTAQSFQDKVQFAYRQVSKLKDFTENMDAIYAVEVKPYIDRCMVKGEKVAFLAFTRREVKRIQDILQTLYPGKSIVSLVSQKGYNSTVFSVFIKKFWDQVAFVPSQSIITVISRMVIDNLDKLVYDKNVMLQSTQRMLASWTAEQSAAINNWQRMHMTGHMGLDQFLDNVRNSMLQFEIRNNSIRQSLLSTKNEENRNADAIANADLIVSTIHGAKGLEFPNVVVTYKNENSMAEDKKRMYYVAFTRAMNTELILAYDTTVYPKIMTDYETIIKTLTQKGLPAGAVQTEDEDAPPDVMNAANTDIARAQMQLYEQGYRRERPKAYVKGKAPVTAADAQSDTEDDATKPEGQDAGDTESA